MQNAKTKISHSQMTEGAPGRNCAAFSSGGRRAVSSALHRFRRPRETGMTAMQPLSAAKSVPAAALTESLLQRPLPHLLPTTSLEGQGHIVVVASASFVDTCVRAQHDCAAVAE